MHQPEQKCAHFCSEWCIMGYGTSASWVLWVWSIMWISLNIFLQMILPFLCSKDILRNETVFQLFEAGIFRFFFSFCQVDGVIYQHKKLLQIPSWFAFMWKLRNGKSISVHFSHELYNDILRYDIPVLMYRDTKSEPCVMWGYLLQVRSLAPYEM